jgi:acyl-CoA thioester hydrolase
MRDTPRSAFPHFTALPTRWMDNDIYGHVNNVVYYSYFDTAVNAFLIARGVLDIHNGGVIGYVVDSGCSYYQSLSFPDIVHAGIRVTKLGTSSVRYEIALYRNDDALPVACGHFVHVYVDRASGKPMAIPAATRLVLQELA